MAMPRRPCSKGHPRSPCTLRPWVAGPSAAAGSAPPPTPRPELATAAGGYINGDAAVSEGYAADAFFITDGRSRQQPTPAPPPPPPQAGGALTATAEAGQAGTRGAGSGAGGQRRARGGHQARAAPGAGSSGGRHACGECGKTYATSSNLSRHGQIAHRQARTASWRGAARTYKVYVSMPARNMHLLTHRPAPQVRRAVKVSAPAASHMFPHRRSPSAARTAARPSPTGSNLRAYADVFRLQALPVCCKKSFAPSYSTAGYESACLGGRRRRRVPRPLRPPRCRSSAPGARPRRRYLRQPGWLSAIWAPREVSGDQAEGPEGGPLLTAIGGGGPALPPMPGLPGPFKQ